MLIDEYKPQLAAFTYSNEIASGLTHSIWIIILQNLMVVEESGGVMLLLIKNEEYQKKVAKRR